MEKAMSGVVPDVALNNGYGYDETLHGFDKGAGKLGLDQIDLLILHQALPSDFDKTTAAWTAPRLSRPSTRSRSTPTSSSEGFRSSVTGTAS
jgi:hypothetical protein